MNANKLLITLEMANNHMGSCEHGRNIIKEFSPFNDFDSRIELAFKLQYRNLDTFIRPDYRGRTDIKHIKRFEETRITREERLNLLSCMRESGFYTMVTPFDEISVSDLILDNVDIIKVASCSFTDWPLHEKIAESAGDKPIILSCAAASEQALDSVISFYLNRSHKIVLQHCVGQYPTPIEDMQLNQIDYIRIRYPEVRFGFSTHESPDDSFVGSLAIAKGASTLEKHVGVPTSEWPLNEYSCSPQQFERWLTSIVKALDTCGGAPSARYLPSQKEADSLRALERGAFAKHEIVTGEKLTDENIFFAFPPEDGQITASDLSKYKKFTVSKKVGPGEPILKEFTQCEDHRERILEVKESVVALLKESGVITPKAFELEVSHHYGLDRYYEYGLSMVTLINRDYCKKLLILLPGQVHPEQYHEIKEETFVVLYGSVVLTLDGISQLMDVGDVVTINPGARHEFMTEVGAVVEEISSTHYRADSYYSDPVIEQNANRKSIVKVNL